MGGPDAATVRFSLPAPTKDQIADLLESIAQMLEPIATAPAAILSLYEGPVTPLTRDMSRRPVNDPIIATDIERKTSVAS